MKFELKSLAAGVILGITIAFTIAATEADHERIGRFQIDSHSGFYIIDTVTGEVWVNQTNPKLVK